MRLYAGWGDVTEIVAFAVNSWSGGEAPEFGACRPEVNIAASYPWIIRYCSSGCGSYSRA